MADPLGTMPTTDRAMRAAVQRVRMYMRDFAELNRLVAGEESSERFVSMAIVDAVDDWNTTPPLIGNVGVSDHPAVHLLVRKATANLLESVGQLQTRNHLSYSDGQGSSVNVSDKAPMLQAWIKMFQMDYETKKQRLKIALNIEGGWDEGINSELSSVGAYYGW